MKYFTLIRNWIFESTARTLTGLLCLSAIAVVATHMVHAASYDVANETQMYLDTSINQTTTAITLSAPVLNGSTWTFATTSGAVLRIRSGNYREDIYYSSATVNATTKKITLNGVVRNICPNQFRSFISCGNGRNWGKGAIVELTQDARIFNLKANIDRANVFTASGAIAFNGSGSFTPPYFLTTAARDQQLGASPSGPVKMACVSGTGLCYLSTGGSWTTIGSTGVSNASETVAGKVQLGTVKDQSGATVNGSTGAPTVVQTQYLVQSGGLVNRGKIPLLGKNGFLSGSTLGTGTRSSSTFLRGDQTFATLPTTFPTVIYSSGTYVKIVGNSAEQTFGGNNYTFAANDLAQGNMYSFNLTGTGGSTGASSVIRVKMGSTELCRGKESASDLRYGWRMSGVMNVQSTGVSGKVHVVCDTIMGTTGLVSSGSTITLNTTTTNTFQAAVYNNSTNVYNYLTEIILLRLR